MNRFIFSILFALSLVLGFHGYAVAANEDLVRQDIDSFCAQARPNDYGICITKMRCKVLKEDCARANERKIDNSSSVAVFFLLCLVSVLSFALCAVFVYPHFVK